MAVSVTYVGNLGSGVTMWHGLALPKDVPVPLASDYELTAGNDLIVREPLVYIDGGL